MFKERKLRNRRNKKLADLNISVDQRDTDASNSSSNTPTPNEETDNNLRNFGNEAGIPERIGAVDNNAEVNIVKDLEGDDNIEHREVGDLGENIEGLVDPAVERVDNNDNNMDRSGFFMDPGFFYGRATEDASDFVKNFKRAAAVNQWNDQKCLLLFPSFLRDAAARWYDSLGARLPDANTFDGLATALKAAFAKVGIVDDWKIKLETRIQADHETVEEFMYDILHLCTKINPEMSEEDKVKYVLKGLKEHLVEKVAGLPNNTIAQLLQNLRNIETGLYYARNRQLLQLQTQGVGSGNVKMTQVSSTQGNLSSGEGQCLQKSIEALGSQMQEMMGQMKLLKTQVNTGKMQSRTNEQRGPSYRNYGFSRDQHFGAPENSMSRPKYTADGRPICFACGVAGHVKRECKNVAQGGAPENFTFRPQRTVDGRPICFGCGKIGHYKRDCRNVGWRNSGPQNPGN